MKREPTQRVGHPGGNVNLNFFIIEQLPIFAPDFYLENCPWHKKLTLEEWISERVLKLTCTSNDMLPLAKSAKFSPPVHKWKVSERLDLLAQLDAAFFLFYDIKEKDVKYILSTFSGVKNEDELSFDSGGTANTIMKYYEEFR